MSRFIILLISIFLVSCLSESEKLASKNLQEFIDTNPYTADREIEFCDFSAVQKYYSYPENLEYLSGLDQSIDIKEFYMTYHHKINQLYDGHPDINNSKIDEELKSYYSDLKQLVLKNDNPIVDSLQMEFQLASKIREKMEQIEAPWLGYSQDAICTNSLNCIENQKTPVTILFDTLYTVIDIIVKK